jgi:hypothetical protein
VEVKFLNQHNDKIPVTARWLFVHLNWLEHTCTNGGGNDWFWHTHEEIALETGIGIKCVGRCINLLEKIGLLKTEKKHWKEADGSLSRKRITWFKIMNIQQVKMTC